MLARARKAFVAAFVAGVAGASGMFGNVLADGKFDGIQDGSLVLSAFIAAAVVAWVATYNVKNSSATENNEK